MEVQGIEEVKGPPMVEFSRWLSGGVSWKAHGAGEMEWFLKGVVGSLHDGEGRWRHGRRWWHKGSHDG